MKRIVKTGFLVGFALLVSCASPMVPPAADESLLLLFVEEYHSPITKPSILLYVDGIEEPVRFDLTGPAAVAPVAARSRLRATAWSAGKGVSISAPGGFEFTAPGGRAALLPFKAMIVNKGRIEIRPLSAFDLEVVRDQLGSDPVFAPLTIEYPEIVAE